MTGGMTAQNRKRIKRMRVDNVTTTSKDYVGQILSSAAHVCKPWCLQDTAFMKALPKRVIFWLERQPPLQTNHVITSLGNYSC